MSRADIPASSKIVAQVFRKTCEITHVKPAVPRAVRTVLISGATGGVGALAIQYAAAVGAGVIATAQPGDERPSV
jgi:NADPH:quinone reductase-like Zn-dependent oxidoreductase